MKRSFVTVGIAGAGLAALALAAWYLQRGPAPMAAPQPVAAKSSAPAGPSTVAVEAVTVAPVALVDDIGAVGSVRSNESIVLRPEVAGRITSINFREGQIVHRGQPLVTLDASVNKAEVDQMRAQLDLAKSNLKRAEELARDRFVSASAAEEAASKTRVAEAALALAEARLSKMTLTAPFDAMVGIRNVSVGDYVKDGADLINLEDIKRVKIDFRVPERFQPQMRVGQRVDVTTDALPGRRFAATIDAIDPLIDANGRSVSVRARADNEGGVLRPGMFARVRVIFAEKAAALMVPEEAIVPSGTEFFVYRVVDGKAKRTKVQVGARKDSRVELLSGASNGDVVVVAGQLKLVRDAMPVRVVAAAKPEGTQDAPKKAES